MDVLLLPLDALGDRDVAITFICKLVNRGVATVYARTHVRTSRNEKIYNLFSMAKSVFDD